MNCRPAASSAPDPVYLSPDVAPVHYERLGDAAVFLWQLDYESATLAAEVQIAPRDNGKHHAGGELNWHESTSSVVRKKVACICYQFPKRLTERSTG